jgi:hypothetical protein
MEDLREKNRLRSICWNFEAVRLFITRRVIGSSEDESSDSDDSGL